MPMGGLPSHEVSEIARLRAANAELEATLAARSEELRAAIEQQAATAEILGTISRAPTDLGPVLETIITNAARLCEAQTACVFLNVDGRLELAAHTPCTPVFADFLKRGRLGFDFGWVPDRARTTGRAALERRPVQVLDVRTEPGVIAPAHCIEGIRSVLAVPMYRGDTLLGVFSIWRREVRAFSDVQIRLLETFASEAVIAIENVRLFQELRARNHDLADALGQQTATSEILRVISSSHTDALPVFETIVRNAVALCGSVFANVFRFDGELIHYVASHNTGPDYVELLRSKYPMRPDTSQVSGRVMLSRSIVRLEDARSDPDYDQRFPAAMGWRRMLGVPMLREGKPLGAIIVGWAEAGPVPKAQEDLLRTFADQAVIALENVRMFDEIQDKSRQLELANTYKSRFLAAASHDLRQPLHALNLFVGQLQPETDPVERKRLVTRVDAAIQAMNELFNALLDVSRLDAGVLEPNLTSFPIEQLLMRVESTFAETAREKGLRLRVVPSGAWARSDFILLERILFNLVSNAVRYTTRGGIVVGCRRNGESLHLEVYDSGPGIPEDQQQHIFREFYQVSPPEQDRRGGLGLGLAIVERLGQLLDHPVDVISRPGKGSRFAVSVPRVRERHGPAEAPTSPATIADPARGKLVVVIDDDALVLDSMCGTLRGWGCQVVAAESDTAALLRLRALGQVPDAIISDYRLAGGQTGIQAIERLCGALDVAVPAFLVSGDTAPDRLREASAHGYHLLHKPVPPMALRAMLNRVLKGRDLAVAASRGMEPQPNPRPSAARNQARGLR